MKGRPLSEYLDDILEAIADIETFTSAINFDDFQNNEKKFWQL